MRNDVHDEESRLEEAIARRMTLGCKFAGQINQMSWEATDIQELRVMDEPGQDTTYFCHTLYGKTGLCSSCKTAFDRLLQAIAFDRWAAAQEVPKSTAFSGSVQKILNEFTQMLPTIVREAYEDVASRDEQGVEVEVEIEVARL
jgi:hypothetical protein